ncbi:TULIP family P47-like protein [Methylorubrum zatmanii]
MASSSAPTSSFTTTTFSGSEPVATNGWDTVYALKVGLINEALAEYFGPGGDFASKLQFSQSMDPTNALCVEGQFGAWQITTGGSGQQVNLTVPISSGTATLKNIGLPQTSFDLAGAALTVEVTLGYHSVSPAASSATPQSGVTTAQLKVVTSGSAPAAGSAADIQSAAGASSASGSSGSSSVVVTLMSGFNPAGLNAEQNLIAANFVKSLVQEWISSNLWMFDYVFLTVDVAETAAQGEWAWIKPTYVGYAVTDLLDANGNALPVENSLIAIMSMTEGRVPGPNLQVSPVVSPNGIPTNPGVNAAFLIQPSLLLSQVIAPNMPALFENSTSGDFTTSSQNLTVSNVNPLTLQLEMDPTWYPFSNPCTATIGAGDLSVSFNQNTIQQTFSNISFPYGAQNELTVVVSLTSTSTIGVDGTGQFTMQYDNDTVSTLSVQPDASKIAAESLEGIGVGLVVTVLCCMSFGAAGGAVASEVGGEAGSAAGETGNLAGEVPNASSLTAEQQEVASEIESGASSEEGANGQITVQGEGTSDINAGQLNTDLARSAESEIKNPGTWSFKGIQPRFTFKIWGMFVGMFAGQVYSQMGNIDTLAAYDQDPTKMPTLRNFLAECIAPATWTNTGNQELVCAGLNGAFVMGFTVPSTAASA